MYSAITFFLGWGQGSFLGRKNIRGQLLTSGLLCVSYFVIAIKDDLGYKVQFLGGSPPMQTQAPRSYMYVPYQNTSPK